MVLLTFSSKLVITQIVTSTTAAMKLTTAALALFASTYGSTTAFVPGSYSYTNVMRMSKAPALFMSSEAPAAEAPSSTGETFE
jgi:hypothetical protein